VRPHRPVGLIGGARQRRADQQRVDQLAGATGQLLGGTTDQLGEDHPGVPARAEQRRPRDGGDDLVSPDVVDRAALGRAGQPIELSHHRAQRQHHVVAGVPDLRTVLIGDPVERVDLFAAGLERAHSGLDQASEPDDARIRQRLATGRPLGRAHLSKSRRSTSRPTG
jgi:hypothetical protein